MRPTPNKFAFGVQNKAFFKTNALKIKYLFIVMKSESYFWWFTQTMYPASIMYSDRGGNKNKIIKSISTSFTKKETCLRNRCQPLSPRVRGKEFENNCLDTRIPGREIRPSQNPHTYTHPSFELQLYQTVRASAHTISPHCNETAELYNFPNL
jgi:hypothetical protein